MSIHIPQELVDIIMNNLHDDIPSLKSCSLAARTFVSSARTHIFRKIEIIPPTDPLSSSNSCQKLYKLLTSSPHLAPLIDELCIVLVGSETSFEYDSDGQYLEERHPSWIMSGRRTLALILPLLDLKRISLVENAPVDWSSYGEFSIKWDELGRHLKSTLSKIFSSPRLESVHLRGIVVESPYQLLSLFSEATSLKEMSLSRVYFTMRWDQRDPWPESQPWRPLLRSLLVSDVASDTFCRHLVNPQINLTHVNSLTIVTEGSDWREKLIQATHGSVVDLRIRYLQEPVAGVIKSIIGPNLRSIHFFTIYTFRLMKSLFKSCPHDTLLESIIFEGPSSGGYDPSLNDAIDSAIVHLRYLKMVEVRTYPWYDFDTPFSVWSAAVLSSLPSLVRRGMLTLTEIPMGENEVHHGWE